jgi:prevent-host-death family protein
MKDNIYGAFSAKTNFSKLLREVEDGEAFIITRRGKAVARIIPFESAEHKLSLDEIKNKLQKIRSQISKDTNIVKDIHDARKYE